MRRPLARPARLALLGLVALGGCDDTDGSGGAGGSGECPEASSSLSIEYDGMPAGEAPAGSTVSFRARLVSVCGDPLGMAPGLEAGAGRVTTADEADGWTRIEWHLAPVPVPQRLQLSAGPIQQEFQVDATPIDPLITDDMGGVAALLAAEGIAGTTEDLAIQAETIVLPVPGGLVRVTGEGVSTFEAVPVFESPLGVASDLNQDLWILDSARSTLTQLAGASPTDRLTAEAPGALVSPNHLAFGPDGLLYISDPCAASLLRFDPETGEVDARLDFDPATQGSPNGVAFDPNGVLHTISGNAVLQCRQTGIAPPDAELSRIWRVPTSADGFGEAEPITEPLATFGDGIAFDQDANLFFVGTSVEGLSVQQNAIFVRRHVDGAIHPVAVAPQGVLYANLTFGYGAFDPQTLYVSLLSVPPLAGAGSRGLHRVEVQVDRGPLWQ